MEEIQEVLLKLGKNMDRMEEDTKKIKEENDKRAKESDKRLREIKEENKKRAKESDKREKESDKRLREIKEENDKREKENIKRIIEEKERVKESERATKQMKKELGGIGQSQEEVGVDLFKRNMKGMLNKRGINVDNVVTKFKNSARLKDGTFLQGEYDLMGINGKDIVVVEVKNKLRNEDINKFLEKQLPRFKILFPQYKNYNLYGGVGSLIVTEEQEKQAERKGLFVFTQGENGNAMIMNNENFKAKIF